jgi:hypothetical protein
MIRAAEVDLPVPVEPSSAKCLPSRGVDIEGAANVLGRIDGADLDMRALVGGEHLPHVLAGDREDLGAGRRIAGDAAAEVDQLAGLRILLAFAEEVDVGDDHARLAVAELEAAHVGEQPAASGLELDVAADLSGQGDARVRIAPDLGHPRGFELDRAAAAANLDHLAERRVAHRLRDPRPDGGGEFLRLVDDGNGLEVHHVGHATLTAPGWFASPLLAARGKQLLFLEMKGGTVAEPRKPLSRP